MRYLLLLTVLILGVPSLAEGVQTPEASAQVGHVPLPVALEDDFTGGTPPAEAQPAWKEFRKRNPNWAALWRSGSASPHRAFGPGIPVTGPVTSSEQAARAARSFLTDHAGLTKAGGSSRHSRPRRAAGYGTRTSGRSTGACRSC